MHGSRWLGALVIAVGAGCAGGPGDGPEGDGDSDVDADADADGDSDVPGGDGDGDVDQFVDATVPEVCATINEGLCARMEQCCGGQWPIQLYEDCRTGNRDYCEQRFQERLDVPGAQLVPAAIEDCLRAIDELYATCPEADELPSYALVVCETIVAGPGDIGDPCGEPSECGPGLHCDHSSGACAPLPGADEHCAHDRVCDGDECELVHWPSCAYGLECRTGNQIVPGDDYCVRIGGLGAPCEADLCGLDQYCDAGGHCAERLSLGEACENEDQCSSRSCDAAIGECTSEDPVDYCDPFGED